MRILQTPVPPDAIHSTLLAAAAQRCPRCHRGHLFTHSTLALAHFSEMPAQCPVCELPYEPEPGFYIGAMYINYAFSTTIVTIVGVVLYNLFADPPTWVYVATVAVTVVGLLPVLLRYSRTLMLYLFGGASYRPAVARPSQNQLKKPISRPVKPAALAV